MIGVDIRESNILSLVMVKLLSVRFLTVSLSLRFLIVSFLIFFSMFVMSRVSILRRIGVIRSRGVEIVMLTSK